MDESKPLLAGEAAAAGRRSRSRASSFRLSEIGDSLEKAFRVRKDGQTSCFRLRIGPDTSAPGGGGGGQGPALAHFSAHVKLLLAHKYTLHTPKYTSTPPKPTSTPPKQSLNASPDP